ncbi:hypothetical protein RQM47_10845 [Rubrivirga sp. S365]|uniref:Lipocalin-like domain-containing protein n=1 Tax=Rubrivirga litoralis TaxID=3075598 RepID=A0ABU3BUV9_9BACT|nr:MULTISPECIES: hypothetical protein [unclassified Rubrivirga]MDT0633070.1 hypothetical protein [Rubrivirga sp. F394]MDT7857137.1 hypothetical protein [Rubrivirga sp. S365]
MIRELSLAVLLSSCAGCAGFFPPREVAGPPAPVPTWVYGVWTSLHMWGFNSSVGPRTEAERFEIDRDGRYRIYEDGHLALAGTFTGEGVPGDPGAVRLRFTGRRLETRFVTVNSFAEWERTYVVRYDQPDSLSALGTKLN